MLRLPFFIFTFFSASTAFSAVTLHGSAHLFAGSRVVRPSTSAKLCGTRLLAYAEAFPPEIRRLGYFLSNHFLHVSQRKLEAAMINAFHALVGDIPARTPIVVWGNQDRSSYWMANLLYEYLVFNLPAEHRSWVTEREIVFFENDYQDEMITYLRLHPEAVVFVCEDAAYSGVQVLNTLRSLSRVVPQNRLRLVLGAITEPAARLLFSDLPQVRFKAGGGLSVLGELLAQRAELYSMAAQVLGHGFENRVITSMPNRFPDDKSSATLRSGALLLEGAVPDLRGQTLDVIPLRDHNPERVY